MRVPLALLMASIVLGAAYYTFLVRVDFPPAIIRVVPFAWLSLAAAGVWLSVRRWRQTRSKLGLAAIVTLNLLSGVIAIPFAMAAALGD